MGIPNKTIYRYLKDFLRLGAIKRASKGRTDYYSVNSTLWPEINGFLTALLGTMAMFMVLREALLIKSYVNSVIFKSIRTQDATSTTFSAYKNYGIELYLRDNYYTLPKRELSITDMFVHSLDSAGEFQQKLFCILFYLKNKAKLNDIDHPMVADILPNLTQEDVAVYVPVTPAAA